MEPIRPKGMPRLEWNALSAKKKAALQHPPSTAVMPARSQPSQPPRAKKWYVQADTSFGNFSAGSGNPRREVQKSRSLVGPAPITINAGPQGRGQPIVQRELVALVSGSLSFQSTTWQFQPGLSSVFAWLSALARLYQKYRVRKAVLIYKPSVSSFDPLGSKGKCALSFDTDALGSPLTSFIQAEGMTPNARFMPYQDCELDISPSIVGDRFVRSGPVPAGSDAKTYDAGTVYFSTDGFGGSGVIGELHCEYIVDLLNPILPNTIPPVINLNWSAYLFLGQPIPDAVNFKFPVLAPDAAHQALGFNNSGGTLSGVSGNFLFTYTVNFLITAANGTTYIIWAVFNGATTNTSYRRVSSGTANLGNHSIGSTWVHALRATDTVEFYCLCDHGASTVTADMYVSIVSI